MADTDPLLPEPLVVSGHVVTLNRGRPEIPDGLLYIDRDGILRGVAARGEPAPPGFAGAKEVATGGLIYPGLIDLHNHMAYNCLPLWISPNRDTPWEKRSQWPRDDSYKPDVSLPANALCDADGKAVLKYVETKAVVGGVTAIQGSAKLRGPFEGWMVRNIEFETFETGTKTVNQSVRQLTSKKQFDDAIADLAKDHAFLYHLSEGADPTLIGDYNAVRDHHCLLPKFVGIHSTALTGTQFGEWHGIANGGSVVWSPFSNLWLYGKTTDVAAAKKAKMRICLGADWSPSGSKNLLGELKVADLYHREQLGGDVFSPRELCAMATCNPADALGWGTKIGRLKKGLHADFVVMRNRPGDVYEALIHSTEADVLLVAINGYPMYGTEKLMLAANAVNPEPIDVAPDLHRTITLRDDRFQDADMSWQDVLGSLEAARGNRQLARTAALARDGVEEPRVTLIPDKRHDDPVLHPELLAEAQHVPIPPLDSLTPDAAYFAAVHDETLHGHQLDGLHEYYPGIGPPV
jgi:5-methylthioadenosine/S-adenosylhomocysteine deaminase